MSDIHDLIDKELAKANKAFAKEIRELYLAAERAESASKALRERAQVMVERLNDADERSNGSAPQVKAKRKPVTVDNTELAAVLLTLEKHSYKAYSAKDIADDKGHGIGLKKAGAALKRLVAEGKAVERARGEFRAVAQPAEADGTGESR